MGRKGTSAVVNCEKPREPVLQGVPFFLYQSYHGVPAPIQGEKELLEYYREKFVREDTVEKPPSRIEAYQ